MKIKPAFLVAASLVLAVQACTTPLDTSSLSAPVSSTIPNKVKLKIRAVVINSDGSSTPVSNTTFLLAQSNTPKPSEIVRAKTDRNGEAELEIPAGAWYVSGQYTPDNGVSVSWENKGFNIPVSGTIDLNNTNGTVIQPSAKPTPNIPAVITEPTPSAKPKPTPTPELTLSPEPTPTATPTPIATPVPTPLPSVEPEPTPVPTPIPTVTPTPIPTPTPLPLSTPMIVPASYPMPTGYNRCRLVFNRGFIATGSDVVYDWQSSLPFSRGGGTGDYIQLFKAASSSTPSLTIFVSSLNPGEYRQGNSTMIYSWNLGHESWSTDDPDFGQSNVFIRGNSNGYIWGDIDGNLGKDERTVLVVGRFACRP